MIYQLILLFCYFLCIKSNEKSDVIILNNDNFEHLTQASTGATTGPWLVEFYAPWCGHCRKLEPVYEKIATALKGEINVAKVDVTRNIPLGNRFDIRGYPTLKYFNLGKMYTLSGPRDEKSILSYVRERYKNDKNISVPPIPSWWKDPVISQYNILRDDFFHLMATKKNVLLVTFLFGFFGGIAVFSICCVSRGPCVGPYSSKKTN